ncbi:MAG: MBL fold metallo-hydrolase [Xanthomonadales bacterium]|nr:MBL fold metallo-hydrolase [Xanthomonadales bacterium]
MFTLKAKTTAFMMLLLLTIVSQAALAVEYTTTRLSDNLTMLKGQGGNVAISSGKDGVFIIDDQLAPITEGLLEAIRKISDQPIRYVINTHYHGDHVGGNETIGKAGAVILTHNNVYTRMSSEHFSTYMQTSTPAYPAAAMPNITFSDEATLHFNGETATAYHIANAHTDGDALIHFPKSNVIHMGDLWFQGFYPYIDLDAGGNIEGIINGVNKALELANSETKIIPGHGPLGSYAELKAYGEFLAEATQSVRLLIAEEKTLSEIIALKPTAKWDESLGKVWIKPDQFVTMIYNSLQGIQEYKQ